MKDLFVGRRVLLCAHTVRRRIPFSWQAHDIRRWRVLDMYKEVVVLSRSARVSPASILSRYVCRVFGMLERKLSCEDPCVGKHFKGQTHKPSCGILVLESLTRCRRPVSSRGVSRPHVRFTRPHMRHGGRRRDVRDHLDVELFFCLCLLDWPQSHSSCHARKDYCLHVHNSLFT